MSNYWEEEDRLGCLVTAYACAHSFVSTMPPAGRPNWSANFIQHVVGEYVFLYDTSSIDGRKSKDGWTHVMCGRSKDSLSS